jgi:hypothetical protein
VFLTGVIDSITMSASTTDSFDVNSHFTQDPSSREDERKRFCNINPVPLEYCSMSGVSPLLRRQSKMQGQQEGKPSLLGDNKYRNNK